MRARRRQIFHNFDERESDAVDQLAMNDTAFSARRRFQPAKVSLTSRAPVKVHRVICRPRTRKFSVKPFVTRTTRSERTSKQECVFARLQAVRGVISDVHRNAARGRGREFHLPDRFLPWVFILTEVPPDIMG